MGLVGLVAAEEIDRPAALLDRPPQRGLHDQPARLLVEDLRIHAALIGIEDAVAGQLVFGGRRPAVQLQPVEPELSAASSRGMTSRWKAVKRGEAKQPGWPSQRRRRWCRSTRISIARGSSSSRSTVCSTARPRIEHVPLAAAKLLAVALGERGEVFFPTSGQLQPPAIHAGRAMDQAAALGQVVDEAGGRAILGVHPFDRQHVPSGGPSRPRTSAGRSGNRPGPRRPRLPATAGRARSGSRSRPHPEPSQRSTRPCDGRRSRHQGASPTRRSGARRRPAPPAASRTARPARRRSSATRRTSSPRCETARRPPAVPGLGVGREFFEGGEFHDLHNQMSVTIRRCKPTFGGNWLPGCNAGCLSGNAA